MRWITGKEHEQGAFENDCQLFLQLVAIYCVTEIIIYRDDKMQPTGHTMHN